MTRLKMLASRLLQMIPVLLGISVLTFVLAQLTPGDPLRALLGPRASEASMQAVRVRYGLDKPILVQYGVYLRNTLQGDLGRSIMFRTPVLDLIRSRMKPTLYLIVAGLVLSVALTLVLAVAASMYPNGWIDQLIRMFGTVGLGLPSFWLAIVFTLFFAVRLDWFPATGFGKTFVEHLHHIVLPSVTTALAMTPILVRNLRATLLDKREADFVIAGQSKGLPDRFIFFRHVFPNSVLPNLHLLGVVVIYIMGSSVITETIFNIPGLGQLMIAAIIGRDYFVVQGLTLFFAVLTILTMLIVDIVSLLVDPRVDA
jgi:peptide/nickel transport system permease protein